MFETLTERLNKTFRNLAGFGKLNEENIQPALREIRVALLEADVHFRVVKSFLENVKKRALGSEVLESVTPADQFVKVVRDELARTLGAEEPPPELRKNPAGPTRILLCGLQGAGKTTAAAKLAHLLGKSALVALDLKRPGAVEQLRVMAEKVQATFLPPADPSDVRLSARKALEEGRAFEHLIFDTAGRLQIDEELMEELVEVAGIVKPDEIVLVLDAMTGQEALNVAETFHKRVPLTALMLTKTDGDARGGAALSIRHVTGIPIKWIGTGERPDAIESFHPERFADRILGMGDVVSLVERAERLTDTKKVESLTKRMLRDGLDLELFLEQMREMRKMGPLTELLSLLPGGGNLAPMAAGSEEELKRFESMILSMTPRERRHPDIIDHSRKRRIARGSGVRTEEVSRMLKQFRKVRGMLGAFTGGKKGNGILRQFFS
ncbi:MAG: signal recognition particle protein [Candidatus Hydrogenedentota bacterium]|nr:MAG: signal recognition particle protein [Candidatus Hydrogenedentota bacterium]